MRLSEAKILKLIADNAIDYQHRTNNGEPDVMIWVNIIHLSKVVELCGGMDSMPCVINNYDACFWASDLLSEDVDFDVVFGRNENEN